MPEYVGPTIGKTLGIGTGQPVRQRPSVGYGVPDVRPIRSAATRTPRSGDPSMDRGRHRRKRRAGVGRALLPAGRVPRPDNSSRHD